MKKFTKLFFMILVMSLLTGCSSVDKEAWQEQYDLGMKCLEEGNYEEAVIAFTKAIEIDAKSAPSYIGRGDAYTGLAKGTDDLEKAKEYCEMALQDYEEAGNLGSEDVEDRRVEVEKFLEEVIRKIEEAVEREQEILRQQEEIKRLFEPLYACFAENNIEGAIELMRQEEYMKFCENISSNYVLYEEEGNAIKLVVYYSSGDAYYYYYFGEFKEGKREGNGLWIVKHPEIHLDYEMYEGQWSNDLPNGEGEIFIQYNGYHILREEIKGSFKNGLYHGEMNITQYWPNEDIYRGKAVAVEGVYQQLSENDIYEIAKEADCILAGGLIGNRTDIYIFLCNGTGGSLIDYADTANYNLHCVPGFEFLDRK